MANYKRRNNNTRLAIVDDGQNNLPSLTPKQESFANYLLDGKSATEAYKLSYDTSNMAQDTIGAEASRLKRDHKVSAYMRHFQRIGLDERKISIENHLADLARLRELAVEERQISAGVQAEHYRGKVSGLYEDKLRPNIGMPDEVLLTQLGSLLGQDTVKLVENALGPKLIDHEPEE